MWYETTMHMHALSMCSVSLKRVYKYPANALLSVFIKSREFNNGEKKTKCLTNLIHPLSRYFSTAQIINSKEQTALVIGRMNIKT